MVLIMDTARFKHPPHWIPLTVLWEAMKRVDPETGKPRGFMVLEKAHNLSHRLFTANSTNYQDWPQVCMIVQTQPFSVACASLLASRARCVSVAPLR